MSWPRLSIILPVLHIHPHLKTTLTRRTKERSLETFKKNAILEIGVGHWTRKYFYFFPVFKTLMLPKHSGYHDHHCVSTCYKTVAARSSSWNLDLESTQAPCRELDYSGRQSAQAACLLGGSLQRGAVRVGCGARVWSVGGTSKWEFL